MMGEVARSETGAGYRWFVEISPRWMDVYVHVNNVLYYYYFATAVAA